jgi:hypothetical protein
MRTREIRRVTCRPPKRDTLPVLREEIHDLLVEREGQRRATTLWRERYETLRARYQAFTEALRAVSELDALTPYPDEADPFDLDADVPF